MNFIAEALLDSVDWDGLRTIRGTANEVPRNLRRLAETQTDEEAVSAYWYLDNEIVVQGKVFQAAAPVVSVLLAMLEGSLSGPARHWTMELLVQISCGWADVSEIALGNSDVIEECRRRAREGIWTIYGQLLDPDREVRECALEVVATIDLERQRVARELTAVADNDHDAVVADFAKDLMRRDRGARQ